MNDDVAVLESVGVFSPVLDPLTPEPSDATPEVQAAERLTAFLTAVGVRAGTGGMPHGVDLTMHPDTLAVLAQWCAAPVQSAERRQVVRTHSLKGEFWSVSMPVPDRRVRRGTVRVERRAQ